MTLVKIDQKMRIRLPKHVTKKLKLKDKESLQLEITGDEIRLSRPTKVDIGRDPVIRDMVERPMKTNIKVTTELLEKWKDEMWLP